jgi:hypothetical protein
MDKKENMKMKDVERLESYIPKDDFTKPTMQTTIQQKKEEEKNLTLNFKGNKKLTSVNRNGINYIPASGMYNE